MAPNDKSTWTRDKIHMGGEKTFNAQEFAPKAWDAICELCGGEDRILESAKWWQDALIVNLGSADKEGQPEAPHDLWGWHVDGDFFVHYLDSPEQGLLAIPLFTDVAPGAGGTVICPEAMPILAKHLYENPAGVSPLMDPRDSPDFRNIEIGKYTSRYSDMAHGKPSFQICVTLPIARSIPISISALRCPFREQAFSWSLALSLALEHKTRCSFTIPFTWAFPSSTPASKAFADLKAEYQKLMDLRSGGTYIPPARLRALQAQMGQDDSDEGKRIQQKFHWEALKKAINGLINKCNISNIKHIVPELFEENLVRGRGLFCRSLMKAQSASLGFTPVFAVLCAAVNSRLPQVGELLVSRLILQFRKAFRRNDKKVCLASTTFLAHLTNQQVVHEFLALQILLLLLNKPTDDSVEIAVGFMKEVGEFLSDMQPRPVMLVWDRFREILHEGEIDKRVQYAVEVLFQIRKDNFKDNPAVKEELDIIEEEDMITHKLSLDDEDLKSQDTLNIFKYDPNFEDSEAAYKRLKAEILGEASGSDDESGDDDSDEDDSSDEDDEEKKIEIQDQSNADLVNLRRTIYLTIKSSMDPEEAVHKLIRVKIPVGFEHELPSMIMECCAQEHTYQKFFGLIGERFAKLNRTWTDLFEKQFATTYETIHRFETNRLRNVARFFGHMFAFDGLGWHIFSVIHLNEDETTSSSRIFIKILFQDIAEIIGMKKLRERLSDPQMQQYYEGIFPRDTPRNVRFSINYFTSIGMGRICLKLLKLVFAISLPFTLCNT
ncbi:Pre-mRNA-splicing factor cwc22 [Ceratocystis platani]|uniref:Pre-mRNA-splicing factor CWC22 n=1 Tax=Ceratocystis fimbriata f. sp. platani TaxID=88771 RepID=A0A0F8BSV4_CERFI|nr:Pre-mRNA-splicing factor cwc22 [Ceratocystis platani]